MIPKVNRLVPSMGAIPTKAMIRPRQPESSPLIMLVPARAAIIERAKRHTPKYSMAENFRVICATEGATNISTRKENRPPRKENTTPVPRALPASPFLAMGEPSKQVAMEEEVPGMLMRMAEIRPPEIPPM